jgi:hypothetical protein
MDGVQPKRKMRVKLPNRRLNETRKVKTDDGHTVFLSVGYDATDPTTPKEVFYDAGFKSGSQLEFQVQDFCILFSLLLQHGMTPDEVAKSLARREQPDRALKYASISGMIVAELTKPPQWGADV